MFETAWLKLKYPKNQLNLALTLSGGQSFRWKLNDTSNATKREEWIGVFGNCLWILRQTEQSLEYKVRGHLNDVKGNKESYLERILKNYFRLDDDLEAYFKDWKKAHKHFEETAVSFKAIRMLQQDPMENIISFICSQNNHIKRISDMVELFCSRYGKEICQYEDCTYFAFPNLDVLFSQDKLEEDLRKVKFGYRAGFISKAIKQIQLNGGVTWLQFLKTMSYKDARKELLKLTGIGPKVADCICLMSLNHLESVPVDTHIYKIARMHYLPNLKKTNSVTTKSYNEVADMFRSVYGNNAGWAQTILFCSDLQKFNQLTT